MTIGTQSSTKADLYQKDVVIPDVTATLKQKTGQVTAKLQERKRQLDEFSGVSSSIGPAPFTTDRLQDLKRRKEETQRVVDQVILEYTQRKMS